MLCAAIYLKTGRGEGALGMITAATAVLAGAYFPLQVLPASIRELSLVSSPFTLLLEGSRALAGQASAVGAGQAALGLAAWSVGGLLLMRWSLGLGLSAVRRRGSLQIVPAGVM
jgi:ABC-type uncharacterized transport system permease subunit